MNLNKCREAYDEYSRKASEVVRHLGFAGLALIWIFKDDLPGQIIVPIDLIWGGALIFISLGLDLLHCIIPTAIWGILARYKENKGVKGEEIFDVSGFVNWPAIFCFWGKIIAMLWAYFILISFLFDKMGG